jgi:hypothetical protein
MPLEVDAVGTCCVLSRDAYRFPMRESRGWVTLEEYLLLFDLLVRPRPCGIHDLVASINPPATDAAQQQRWRRRQRDLTEVFLRLYQRGLVHEAVPPGVVTADVYELTPAGRDAVINADRLWRASRRDPAEGQVSVVSPSASAHFR